MLAMAPRHRGGTRSSLSLKPYFVFGKGRLEARAESPQAVSACAPGDAELRGWRPFLMSALRWAAAAVGEGLHESRHRRNSAERFPLASGWLYLLPVWYHCRATRAAEIRPSGRAIQACCPTTPWRGRLGLAGRPTMIRKSSGAPYGCRRNRLDIDASRIADGVVRRMSASGREGFITVGDSPRRQPGSIARAVVQSRQASAARHHRRGP